MKGKLKSSETCPVMSSTTPKKESKSIDGNQEKDEDNIQVNNLSHLLVDFKVASILYTAAFGDGYGLGIRMMT